MSARGAGATKIDDRESVGGGRKASPSSKGYQSKRRDSIVGIDNLSPVLPLRSDRSPCCYLHSDSPTQNRL